MSLALYRKYRSRDFDEILGQEHITDILKSSLKNNSTSQAYLFTGSRGTGKTSTARILAHKLTGTEYGQECLDIIEMDAASNTSVDDIRSILEKVSLAPTSAKRKVYIIDEVHMLSNSAFNAFLKTLEEPPKHVVFIMATTNFEKLPDTIVSRSQRFHFHLVDNKIIFKHLEDISKKEKIDISKEALEIITERGGGSFRDSISLLDQVKNIRSDSKITKEDVENILGLASSKTISNIVLNLKNNNAQSIVKIIQDEEKIGTSIDALTSQIENKIGENLSEYPYFIKIIEKLPNVKSSRQPSIALLSALLSIFSFNKQPGSKALNNNNLSVTDQKTSNGVDAIQKNKKNTNKIKQNKENESIDSENIDDKQIKSELSNNKSVEKENNSKKEIKDISNFSWSDVTEILPKFNSKAMAICTILKNSQAEFKDGKIMIYVGKKFSKTRLETPKNSQLLNEIIKEAGYGDIDTEIIAETAPPKDKNAAKIAELMGGGEEVNV